MNNYRLRVCPQFLQLINIITVYKGRETKWIGHILRRNGPLNQVIEGKIEWMERRGRRRKQLVRKGGVTGIFILYITMCFNRS